MDKLRKIYLQLFADDPAGGGQEPAPADDPSEGDNPDDRQQDRSQEDGLPDDPAALRKEIEKLRRENAKYRTRAKGTEEQLEAFKEQMAKLLGLKSDKELEADKLAARVEELQAKYRQEKLRNAFWRLAEKKGADVELTYAVLVAAGDLDNLDVDDDGFEEALAERIEAALKANPKLRKEPPAPPKSGADLGAGGGNDGNRPKDLRSALAAYYGRQ